MMWHPLRSLAGRLVLVTIAAIAISYAVVFTLFANERGESLRRFAETAVSERIAFSAERLKRAAPEDRPALVRGLRDFGISYHLSPAPANQSNGGESAQRISRLVSEALDGAKVWTRTREVDVETPRRWRRVTRGPRPDAPPDDPRARPPPPDGRERDMMIGPEGPGPGGPGMGDSGMGGPGGQPNVYRYRIDGDEDGPRFRATEAIVSIELDTNSWLEARARLPAPRPVPASYFWAALASMIAVGIGAVLVARQIGRPLSDLAAAAQRLGAGDMDVSVPARGPDDVRRASEAFNAMAQRLGRQMARQRQMLWALSHDLRTPITALRLRAELLEDDAARQKIVGPLAEMEVLTEQALALARAGSSEETKEVVDIAEIARTLCGELDEMGVKITADAPQAVRIACRPMEIARAMRNLAENASKYGGGGVLRVRRDGAGALIEALDEGPGLPEAELKRVTEPFYRADSARSGEGGAGLGLAIVQAIADGHGGRLTLENRTPKGFRAALYLPA